MAPHVAGDRARGASILELALITPVMALVVMGVLDLALAHRQQLRLENAVREGAVHAELHPADVDCTGNDDIEGRITGEDEGISALDGFEIVVSRPGASGTDVRLEGCGVATVPRGTRVRVEVRSRYHVMTPLVSRVVGSSVPVTATVEVEVQA